MSDITVIDLTPRRVVVTGARTGADATFKVNYSVDDAPVDVTGDTFVATVKADDTYYEPTITPAVGYVKLVWTKTQTTAMGAGNHKIRFARMEDGLEYDTFEGDFKVEDRV